MNYNPADYNAVLSNAKGMSKEELEKDYVNERSKRHWQCGDVIGIMIIILMLTSVLIFAGYTTGQNNMKKDIKDNIETVEKEMCYRIYGDYKSPEFFNSILDTNRIICD